MIAYFIDGPLDLTKCAVKTDTRIIFAQVFDHGDFLSYTEDPMKPEKIIHKMLVRYRRLGNVGIKNQSGEHTIIYLFDGYDEA